MSFKTEIHLAAHICHHHGSNLDGLVVFKWSVNLDRSSVVFVDVVGEADVSLDGVVVESDAHVLAQRGGAQFTGQTNRFKSCEGCHQFQRKLTLIEGNFSFERDFIGASGQFDLQCIGISLALPAQLHVEGLPVGNGGQDGDNNVGVLPVGRGFGCQGKDKNVLIIARQGQVQLFVSFLHSVVVAFENHLFKFGERSGDFHSGDDIVKLQLGLDKVQFAVTLDLKFSGGLSGNVVLGFNGSCLVSCDVAFEYHNSVKGVMSHLEFHVRLDDFTGDGHLNIDFLVLLGEVKFGHDGDGFCQKFGLGGEISSANQALHKVVFERTDKDFITVQFHSKLSIVGFDVSNERVFPLIALQNHFEFLVLSQVVFHGGNVAGLSHVQG